MGLVRQKGKRTTAGGWVVRDNDRQHQPLLVSSPPSFLQVVKFNPRLSLVGLRRRQLTASGTERRQAIEGWLEAGASTGRQGFLTINAAANSPQVVLSPQEGL